MATNNEGMPLFVPSRCTAASQGRQLFFPPGANPWNSNVWLENQAFSLHVKEFSANSTREKVLPRPSSHREAGLLAHCGNSLCTGSLLARCVRHCCWRAPPSCLALPVWLVLVKCGLDKVLINAQCYVVEILTLWSLLVG